MEKYCWLMVVCCVGDPGLGVMGTEGLATLNGSEGSRSAQGEMP